MRRRLVLLLAALAAGIVVAAAAPAVASAWTLTLNLGGNAAGEVVSAGFDCQWDGITESGDCDETYPGLASVGLVAYPVGIGVTVTWTGCSSVVGNQCLINPRSTDLTVTATFTRGFVLTVNVVGSGVVNSSPAGISNCGGTGGTCSALFGQGTQVTLSPTAATGWFFVGWSGACTGGGACVVPMTQAQSVTATFSTSPGQFVLTVSVRGKGGVTSSPPGIACGNDCMASYGGGTLVVLNANPRPGYELVRFEGCDVVVGNECTVTMNGPRSVEAVFRDVDVAAVFRFAEVVTRRDGSRLLRIEIRTEERIRVTVDVERRNRTLFTRTKRGVRPGLRTIKIVIPDWVPGGRARIEIALRDGAGNVEFDGQRIRIPR